MVNKGLKILLVEDQIMVQQALATLMRLENGIELVKTADDAEFAMDLLTEEDFDMVITDIELPGMSGLDLCFQIAEKHEGIKRIIITTFGRGGYVKRALESKVEGFILKDMPTDDLMKCIKDVAQGKRVIDSDLLINSYGFEDVLNQKERQLLRLAKQGKSNQEIADILHLSLGTAKNYMSACIAKLAARNRIDAIRIADKKGML